MGQYNPNQPLAAGNEFAPLISQPYTPDLFVERGWSFKADPGEMFYAGSMFVDEMPAWGVPGHAYVMTLYRRGQEVNTGPMEKVRVPLNWVAQTNTQVGGGASTASPAILNPTDGWYLRMRSDSSAESWVRLRTNSIPSFLQDPAVTQGKRIVDVSIVYAASAEPGNETPVPLEINHRYAVRSERVSYGHAEVALREPLLTELSRSRWGEICTWTKGSGVNPFTEDTSRAVWNYRLLSLFDTGNDFQVEFRTQAQDQDGPDEIYLHYAAMEITYCDENRVGSWATVFGADYDLTDDTGQAGGYRLGRNVQGPGNGFGFVTPNGVGMQPGGGGASFNRANAAVTDLTLTIKRADYGPYNNQGALPRLRALRDPGGFAGHPGVVINNTLEEGFTNSIQNADLLPQMIIHQEQTGGQNLNQTPAIPAVHVYGVQWPMPVNSESVVRQEIEQTAQAPQTEFPHLTFWARHFGATANLRIGVGTQHQTIAQVADLSTAEFDPLPEIVDGWRRVDLVIDPAILIDDDGTSLTGSAPRFYSETSPYRSWEVLGAKIVDQEVEPVFWTDFPSQTGFGTYGDEVNSGYVVGHIPPGWDSDVSVFWTEEPPEIEGLTVAQMVQPIDTVDPECPIDTNCQPDGIMFLRVSWDPVPDGWWFAGLDHYELQRQDETMGSDEWETIARPVHALSTEFDDFEARVGVETTYRIRYVHHNDVVGPWSVLVSDEIPAPGVTGASGGAEGVLVFTSNVDPERNLAYVPVWNGEVSEDFEFVEAGTRALQRMYGRDYQVAFQPAERGGVAFSRVLMVNATAIPIEPLRRGFESLRDLAWADLPYIAVRSEQGDRWLANVNVPAGTIRSRRKIYLSEVTITEVTDEPFAPEPGFCEGMTALGTLPALQYLHRYAITHDAASINMGSDLAATARMRLDHFNQFFPLVARFDSPDQYRGWVFEFDNGILRLKVIETAGISESEYESDPVPFGPGEPFSVRVDYDRDGGSMAPTPVMPEVLGTTHAASGTTGAWSINRPAGNMNGVVLLLLHAADVGGIGDMGTPTGGTTWNLLEEGDDLDDDDDGVARLWWKVGGGSEPASYGLTQDSGADGVAIVVAVAGVNTSDIDSDSITSTTGSGPNIPTPQVAMAAPGGLDIRFGVTPVSSTVINPPGGWDQISNPTPTPWVNAGAASRVVLDGAGTAENMSMSSGNSWGRFGATVTLPGTVVSSNASSAQFWTSPDGDAWTMLGTNTIEDDPVPASMGNNESLTVGAVADGSADYVSSTPTGGAGGWNGAIMEAEVFNGADISAPRLASPDFQGLPGETVEITDAEGNVWNIADGVCTIPPEAY